MEAINKIKEWWKKVFDKFKDFSETMSYGLAEDIDRNLGSHVMERRR